jgi:drug/metabolite transporter (DMT)-like permease
MSVLVVRKSPQMESGLRVRLVLAFLAIYFLWGSTFLSIRIAVETVPPLFAAGVRFFIAGFVLYLWSRARGEVQPTRVEWRNLAIMGALMFLFAYSGLFWAEKTIPSGIASVLVATIPVWTALLQIFILRKEHFRWALIVSIALGVGGVCVLALNAGGRTLLNIPACFAILGAEISWSIGTVLSKVLRLPHSKALSAGAQMLLGGAMLLVGSALLGEMHPFPHVSLRAGLAIGYLIVAGSLVSFTAYIWLLGRMPPTIVTSYAYVNPVVALIVGHWLGNEELGLRTAVGAALILASVLVLTLKRSSKS